MVQADCRAPDFRHHNFAFPGTEVSLPDRSVWSCWRKRTRAGKAECKKDGAARVKQRVPQLRQDMLRASSRLPNQASSYIYRVHYCASRWWVSSTQLQEGHRDQRADCVVSYMHRDAPSSAGDPNSATTRCSAAQNSV